MVCPRCKGFGLLVDRRAMHLPTCVEIQIIAFTDCHWCNGSGVSDNADLAGAGIAEGGTAFRRGVASVTEAALA